MKYKINGWNIWETPDFIYKPSASEKNLGNYLENYLAVGTGA